MDGVYQLTTFGPKHLAYVAGTAVVIVVTLLIGVRRADSAQKSRLVWFLVAVSICQEIVYDAISLSAGTWLAARDLPLHLCSMAIVVSAWAVWTRRQFAFEVAYFWGLVAASQAIITPDPTRWRLGELDAFWNFLYHGLIVLNVGWLVVVEGMRLRRRAWIRVFWATNATALVVGGINLATGWNYFFLREKPSGDNPFLVGEWPWYLLVMEAVAVVMFVIVELPLRQKDGVEATSAGPDPEPDPLPEAA